MELIINYTKEENNIKTKKELLSLKVNDLKELITSFNNISMNQLINNN